VRVVADSGPLMALGKLSLLDLLHGLFGQVLVPRAVHDEVVVRGMERDHADAFAVHLAVRRGHLLVVDLDETRVPVDLRALPLDRGEKHALHLALRDAADLVLLDDLKAREEARARGLIVKGTLGILASAHRRDLLTFPDVEAVIEGILLRDDLWIAEGLCRQVLVSLRAERQAAEDR